MTILQLRYGANEHGFNLVVEENHVSCKHITHTHTPHTHTSHTQLGITPVVVLTISIAVSVVQSSRVSHSRYSTGDGEVRTGGANEVKSNTISYECL